MFPIFAMLSPYQPQLDNKLSALKVANLPRFFYHSSVVARAALRYACW